MTKPYFYIIQHNPSNRKYAGIRVAEGCNPEELLLPNGYHTSSNRVHNLIKTDGLESFSIVSVQEMEDPFEHETKFLTENNCANSDEWLNFHDNRNTKMAPFGSKIFRDYMIEKYGVTNCMHDEKIKEKVRQLIKQWVKDNPEKVKQQGEKVRQWTKNNPEKAKARALKVAENKIKNGTSGKGLSKKHTNNGKTGKWIRGEHHKEAISSRQKEISVFIHNNPMDDPEKRKLVSLSKIGRKRVYREDGSFYMSKVG